MAQDKPPQDLMHYEAMAQDALRGVVRAALERAASPQGLPGAHHFYVTFRTDAAGVEAPPSLLDKYPEEMTIVLQHQYWDLDPGGEAFAVTLKFGGEPNRIVAPYAALTRFYDPSVQFLLQFEPLSPGPAAAAPPSPDARADPQPQPAEGEGPKVVSLDQFRKK